MPSPIFGGRGTPDQCSLFDFPTNIFLVCVAGQKPVKSDTQERRVCVEGHFFCRYRAVVSICGNRGEACSFAHVCVE